MHLNNFMINLKNKTWSIQSQLSTPTKDNFEISPILSLKSSDSFNFHCIFSSKINLLLNEYEWAELLRLGIIDIYNFFSGPVDLIASLQRTNANSIFFFQIIKLDSKSNYIRIKIQDRRKINFFLPNLLLSIAFPLRSIYLKYSINPTFYGIPSFFDVIYCICHKDYFRR